MSFANDGLKAYHNTIDFISGALGVLRRRQFRIPMALGV